MEVPQQNNLSLGPGHPFECRLENVAKQNKTKKPWRFKILLLLCHQFFNSYDLHVFLCFPPEYCFCFWFNMTVGDRGSFVCHNHFLPEFLYIYGDSMIYLWWHTHPRRMNTSLSIYWKFMSFAQLLHRFHSKLCIYILNPHMQLWVTRHVTTS